VTDIAKAGGGLLRRLAGANRKPRSFRCTAFVWLAPSPLAVEHLEAGRQ